MTYTVLDSHAYIDAHCGYLS